MAMGINTDTLCVHCGNACGGCSWSDGLKPEDNWLAEETKNGYRVIACPKYTKDRRIRELDTSGAILLIEAMGKQLREDYIRGRAIYHEPAPKPRYRQQLADFHVDDWKESRKRARRQIEQWLTDGEGKFLFQISDPVEVIQQLRKLAEDHDRQEEARAVSDEWRRDLP